ncbi:acetylglutamate kinase [Alkalicaulis satelles]|uniref:Acetylglutamate kinase n=1 Tax=Alkalicaulis satelles TaxID=2609175 RepID=A0A5M6Z9B6_9PROT|nr:acetylglutamate kinase [Alkalicaulis satelles]KAA5800935.1 acetylglutamate kinase [Alkalicaulis satelles]
MTRESASPAAQPAPVRAAIVQLLSNMRDGKEIREYLTRFSALDQERFAVIKVGGAIIEEDLEALAGALAFLQSVGLAPIVVHGGGPQLNTALEAAGFPEQRVDGLRITPPDAMGAVRDTLTAVNLKLVQAVRDCGGRAAAIPSGVFEAELIDEVKLGRVGEPSGVRLDLVAAAARAGQAPILGCLGDTADGRLVNVNADSAVRALVHALQPYKIVFLTGTGALLDAQGAPISAINLATDHDDLMAADWVTGGMRLKLQEIKRLLDDLPLSSSVSITRPSELAKELFTHAGAGTLVRRGERMLELASTDQMDQPRMAELIERSFGRKPVADYFNRLDFDRAFVTEQYRAAAITARLGDAVYLDKFAVLDEARGEGLGGAVWKRLIAHAPRLYWRSRSDNPVNDFYFSTCHGAVKQGRWTVFWRGEDDLTRIPQMVARIAALPPTLEEA